MAGPRTLKAKQSILDKAASRINRIASGQPKGRKETDSPTKMAKARKAAAQKNPKAPARSKPKYGAGQGSVAKARKAYLDKKIKQAGG